MGKTDEACEYINPRYLTQSNITIIRISIWKRGCLKNQLKLDSNATSRLLQVIIKHMVIHRKLQKIKWKTWN
jgi:hypothetical protein